MHVLVCVGVCWYVSACVGMHAYVSLMGSEALHKLNFKFACQILILRVKNFKFGKNSFQTRSNDKGLFVTCYNCNQTSYTVLQRKGKNRFCILSATISNKP